MVVADGLLATIVEFKRFYAFAKGDEQSGRRDSGKGDGDGGGGLLTPWPGSYLLSACRLGIARISQRYYPDWLLE